MVLSTSFYTIRANSALDPDEYLTAAILQWCQQQLAQLSLATPPVASDGGDALPIPAESVTPTPPGLPDPPVPLLSTRLLHRPSIMVPNAATTAYPPAFGLAGSQIRRTAFPRQRNQLPSRIQSSTLTPVTADRPPPLVETKYLFSVSVAIGRWLSEDALECRFAPLENKASAEINSNKDLVLMYSFMSSSTQLKAFLFRQHSAMIEVINVSL